MTGPRRAVRDQAAPNTVTTDAGVFTTGDRVACVGRPGDEWRITHFYPASPERPEPVAGLRLIGRVGGLPLGETGTAVPVGRLRHIDPPDDALTVAAGYDGRPVILLHLEVRPGTPMAACTGEPYHPPAAADPAHVRFPRVLCVACRVAVSTPRPGKVF